ncbi:lipase member M-like [Trachemys scripta elegans]|uniref:lipase member M-like n=1 Tax=Trachemys scripta elegans TaxID=31138 RepID=UPI001554FB41|nr:lipase member M-like [Trachemys scripta elegans]
MSISEIIRYRGYLSEEYEIMTDDSYYLSINRIPFGIENGKSSGLNPVLLQHGLVLEGTTWVANMANSSLGFILADFGYDVWIGNNRGNNYWARKHYNLTADQEEFSDNSFSQHATHDLPAIINFILQKTGQVQLYYIGYFQGTTLGFVAFSSMPQLAQKIKMFFALAPIITLKHSKSPLVKLFFLPEGINRTILGQKEFSVKGEILSKFTVQVCRYRVFQKLCSLVFSVIRGFNEKNLIIVYIYFLSRIDIYLSHFPDSTSVKTMLHWGQTFKTGEFRYFDYCSEENEVKYNQTEAPLYRLEDMKVPTALWYGGEDWLVDLEDIKILLPQITNLQYEKYIPDWAHFNFN